MKNEISVDTQLERIKGGTSKKENKVMYVTEQRQRPIEYRRVRNTAPIQLLLSFLPHNLLGIQAEYVKNNIHGGFGRVELKHKQGGSFQKSVVNTHNIFAPKIQTEEMRKPSSKTS